MADLPPPRPTSDRIRIDERLTLEPLGPQHVDAGAVLIDRSRDELTPWMPWAEASDAAGFRTFVEAAVEKWRDGTRAAGPVYAIVVDGAFAGCIDFHGEIAAERSAQIGYWLGTAYWGRGWMTRSVVALTAHGFGALGLRRIEILADAENVRSRAVAVRAGYAFVTIRPHATNGREEAVYERFATLHGGGR